MKVKEIMTPNPITLNLEDSIQDLITLFRDHEIGSVIIVDIKNEPYQIITLKDLTKICFVELFPGTVTEVLKKLNKSKESLITIYHNEPYVEALALMKKNNISHLPVVNKRNKLIGVLSIRDIAKTFPEVIYLDPLTGVYNRSYLELIKTKLKKVNGPTIFLMIDIDNFKDINDNFGHLVGDKVLKRLAHTLRKNVKTTDEIIRYGGEEFLVIAYRCNLEEGKKLGERLRRKVESIRFRALPQLKITVSVGVAMYEPKDDFLDTIQKADKAMYEAKKRGKNRVFVYINNSSFVFEKLL